MNPTQMTPDEMRVVIAEACGWRRWTTLYRGKSVPGWKSPSGAVVKVCPNYPNDLNAMAAAEKTLTDDDHWKFRMHLKVLVAEDGPIHSEKVRRNYCSATAAQRAEAFCRTLNKL